jgi:hypothetical protein
MAVKGLTADAELGAKLADVAFRLSHGGLCEA